MNVETAANGKSGLDPEAILAIKGLRIGITLSTGLWLITLLIFYFAM